LLDHSLLLSKGEEANEFLPKLASRLDASLPPSSVRILEALLPLRDDGVDVIEADPLHRPVLSANEEAAIKD
jgi:hypothetical protein